MMYVCVLFVVSVVTCVWSWTWRVNEVSPTRTTSSCRLCTTSSQTAKVWGSWRFHATSLVARYHRPADRLCCVTCCYVYHYVNDIWHYAVAEILMYWSWTHGIKAPTPIPSSPVVDEERMRSGHWSGCCLQCSDTDGGVTSGPLKPWSPNPSRNSRVAALQL